MSAYIVDESEMHLCVEALLGENENPTTLGIELYAMNARAVNARYRSKDEAPLYEHVRRYPASKLAQLRALETLLYQCQEGDVPEEALYKRVYDGIYDLRGAVLREYVKEYRG